MILARNTGIFKRAKRQLKRKKKAKTIVDKLAEYIEKKYKANK